MRTAALEDQGQKAPAYDVVHGRRADDHGAEVRVEKLKVEEDARDDGDRGDGE